MVRESEWSFKSLLSSWTEIYPKNNCSLIILHNIAAKPNNNFQTNSCSRFDSDDVSHQAAEALITISVANTASDQTA